MPSRGFLATVTGGILAALAVTAVYWPARENGFVWDDWLPLVNSPVFRDPALWREAILTAPLKDPVATRPVAMLSFMLQLWAGQTEPGPFHVVNIMVHAANVFLLVLVAWHFLRDASWPRIMVPGAVLSGLVYGFHPALTESVLWISCRYDLLMTFFLLQALLLDRALPAAGWARPVLVSAAFIFAVLSKETAVGFLLALPFVHLALSQSRGEPLNRAALARTLAAHYRVYIALFVASALYLAARYALFGASIGMQRMAVQFEDIPSLDQRVLAVVASLAQHVSDALWPFQGIIPSRALQLPVKVMDILPAVATSACAFIAVIVAGRTGAAGRSLALLFLAFIASLVPVSNLIPLPGRQGELWVASRYLTFPLALLCLAGPYTFRVVASLLESHGSRLQALLLAMVVAWVAASVANVRVTIPLWKNEGTLGLWGIRQGATDNWRHLSLGEYYLKTGALHEAREAFVTAAALRNDVGETWYFLGLVEAQLDNTAEAGKAFRRALSLDRDIIKARINIAKLELAAGNTGAAAEVLEGGLGRLEEADDPDQIGVLHYLLGQAYSALGRTDEAVMQLKAALARAQNPQERDAAEKALRSLAPPR